MQKRNPAELLRLYLMYGDLNEASRLCCDYIAALLGRGREMFGIECSISVSSPPMYLPVNAIDILLHELQHHQVSFTFLFDSLLDSVYILKSNAFL